MSKTLALSHVHNVRSNSFNMQTISGYSCKFC